MKNKLFASTIVILFFLGIGIFLLPQRKESAMEKRTLFINENISFKALNKEVESLLKDQFYFRDTFTHNYYQIKTSLNRAIDKTLDLGIKLVYEAKGMINGNKSYSYQELGNDIQMTYLSENVIEINDGYLINKILEYNDEQIKDAASRGYNVNEFDKKYSEIKTYVYFPTRIEEMLNAEKEYHLLCRENYLRQLNGNISYSFLEINDIKDHQKYFYKSDEHWNASGAYQGYKDIVEMINEDYDLGKIKEIEKIVEYEFEFKGNIASQIGMVGQSDRIVDYKLKDLGEFDYYVNGQLKDFDEVKKQYAESGNNTVYSDYDYYFGDNYFLRLFDFHQEERPNLLIFGDSMINTNMSWIASHFNKTIIIDLRAKDDNFYLDYYLKEYDIDIALIDLSYNTMYFNGNLFIPLD